MKISMYDWVQYRDMMARISRKAADDFEKRFGGKVLLSDRKEVIDYAMALVEKYSDASSELACQMYERIAELSGEDIPRPIPAPAADYGEVAKGINGTLKQSPEGKLCSDVIDRLVKRAGADTMLLNAKRDGAQFAWIPNGDTCSFCIMLASRGWQHISEKSLKDGHAEHIHAHCDCQYAVRFDNATEVEGYDPDMYLEMYENAEGDTWQEKLNAMRREQEKEAKGKKEILHCKDVTEIWHSQEHKKPKEIVYMNRVNVKGTEYCVDGVSVKLNPDKNEVRVARLLTEKLGGRIELWPTITKPRYIMTPDYVYYGQKVDLKTPTKTNKDTLFNSCHKKKGQADGFVFDISNIEMSREEAIKQAEALFKRRGTLFVKRVFLVDGDDIFKILEKK